MLKYTHNVNEYKGCTVFVIKAMQYIEDKNRHQSYFSTLVAVAAIPPTTRNIFIQLKLANHKYVAG
jgi:hypothetical protein